jgi:hypothetical protein
MPEETDAAEESTLYLPGLPKTFLFNALRVPEV